MDEFDSLGDIGWYGSAYLLTSCCFQLTFGKLYAEFNTKWVFITSLVIFEVGSVVCATAPSSVALVIGRAIAGIGVGGLFSGALIVCFVPGGPGLQQSSDAYKFPPDTSRECAATKTSHVRRLDREHVGRGDDHCPDPQRRADG